MTRGQLIDDAFFLAHAGIIDYEIPHDLIKYLDDTDEEEYVIGVASNHLRYLEAMSSEETSTNETNYSVFSEDTWTIFMICDLIDDL